MLVSWCFQPLAFAACPRTHGELQCLLLAMLWDRILGAGLLPDGGTPGRLVILGMAVDNAPHAQDTARRVDDPEDDTLGARLPKRLLHRITPFKRGSEGRQSVALERVGEELRAPFTLVAIVILGSMTLVGTRVSGVVSTVDRGMTSGTAGNPGACASGSAAPGTSPTTSATMAPTATPTDMPQVAVPPTAVTRAPARVV
jgi:hypothetical protein